MPFVHGRTAGITLDGKDLSSFSNNIAFNRSADTHQTTSFGGTSHTFAGGLRNGTCTVTGTYDSITVTGPRAIIRPLIGNTVTLLYRPEGTGSGRPLDTVTVVVGGYDETAPVADMVTWSATFQLSGDVVTTAQV